MKLNWGKAIILAFVVFISFIIYIVSGSMRTKIDLVAKDYYSKELKYQDDINKQNNANALSNPLQFEIKQSQFLITLPTELHNHLSEGKVVFYRPSDAKLDKEFTIKTETGLIEVPNGFLSKGKWLIILDVKNRETEYQFKESLFL